MCIRDSLTACGIPVGLHATATKELFIGSMLSAPGQTIARAPSTLVHTIRFPFGHKDSVALPLATVAGELMPWAATHIWEGDFVQMRHMLKQRGIPPSLFTEAAAQLLIGAVLNYELSGAANARTDRTLSPIFRSATMRPGSVFLDLDIEKLLAMARNTQAIEHFTGMADHYPAGTPWGGWITFARREKQEGR